MAFDDFTDKLVVVTGAGSGMGRAYAIEFAKEGARLSLCDIDPVGLSETVAALAPRNGANRVFFATVDVADEEAVFAFADESRTALGDAHVLINNAGINNRKAIVDFSLEEWNEILGVNLTGPFLCSRAFVPGMRKKKWGRIVNMTSIMSRESARISSVTSPTGSATFFRRGSGN